MMLQPDPTQTGLWTNPAWSPGDPGTFVVLIGVSAYPYLKDGSAAQLANENYGLGQLAVTALTTYRLFEWLRDRYLYTLGTGSPCQLAQCWLLLSPTEAERALMKAEVLEHTLPPTFDNCRRALKIWHNAMQALSDESAAQSRAVFFFSGHGLEVSIEEQILLPMDYLEPTLGSLNDAINMGAARLGMKKLKVNNQFFFQDACRNATQTLGNSVVHGDGVFDQSLAYMANPDCNQMVMFATASGQQTFGPRSVDKGLSLFGQSLLWGLQAQHNYQLNQQQPPFSIQWSPLHQFVGTSYNELLAQYNSPLKQKVKVSGEFDDSFAVVTHILPSFLETALKPPVLPAEYPFEIDNTENVAGNLIEDGDGPSGGHFSEETHESFDNILGKTREDPIESSDVISKTPRFKTYAQPGERLWNPFNEQHTSLGAGEFFGRETVTEVWYKAHLFRLDVDREDNAMMQTENYLNNPILFKRIERTADKIGYRVVFSIPSPGLYWLQLSDDRNHYGCILPYSPGGPTPFFQIEFIVNESEQFVFKLDGLQVNLASDSAGTLSKTAPIWEQYENFGATKAAEIMDVQFLKHLVAEKMSDSLSALIASVILLRLGRTDKLPQAWLENLLNRFPNYPDTPVLLNEYLTRTGTVISNEAIYNQRLTECLLTMHKRGLPIIGEGLSYAIQVGSILTNGLGRDKLLPETIAKTLGVLKDARQYFLPGGLFTVFAGNKQALNDLRDRWKLTI